MATLHSAYCVLQSVQQPEGLDLREEPEKGLRLVEPVAARRRSARAARGGSFTERDFRRLCAVMRREQDAHPFATEEALLAHVAFVAAKTGLPCPPEAIERLTGVLACAAVREQAALEDAWRERCERAGHYPRCRTADKCMLRILRRSVGPHVTLEYVRELRAARENTNG